jgi:2,4-dienoyl-CoA reductase (NADPH2)
VLDRFPLLFSPLSIGALELRNRLVMPAMLLNYSKSGQINPRTLEFYRRRAAGGVGLIIIGGCPIGPLAGRPEMISVGPEADLTGLSRLAEALRAEGAVCGVQLFHAGAYAFERDLGGRAVSSSAHTSRFTREKSRELSLEEIAGIHDQYAQAALRAKQAGFDMVEILASAGYLICQFLSPRINQREDAYGGSMENRMRFGLEAVARVRRAVGEGCPVGVRVAGNDFVPGSHGNPESARFAAQCIKAGADLINVTGGWHETKVPQLTGDLPTSGFSYLARGIKQACKAPVCASNRINLPGPAEELLARGDADLICLGRPLIADPDWCNKAGSGKPELIRPCIACNQGCFDSLFQGGAVGCSVNPGAGYEYLPKELPPIRAKKVLVIGGGPAGCSAALAAAGRGHQVTLWEAGSRLGGQPLWYGAPLHKPDFSLLGPHFEAALTQAGVKVALNRAGRAGSVRDFSPDVAILATGSAVDPPPIPGVEDARVVTAWDILKGKRLANKEVVVVGGGAVGLETAIYLAQAGALSPAQLHFLTLFNAEESETMAGLVAKGSRRVTVVEMLPKLGQDIGRSTRWITFGLLKRYGVATMTNTRVLEINKNGVTVSGRAGEITLPADTVVLATGARPNNLLLDELKGLNIEVYPLGDAAQVRDLGAAIAHGTEIASTL